MEEDYGFCRVCLKIKSETFSIYQLYKNEHLPSIIYNISGVTINQIQEPTAVICKQCALAVLVGYKIILRCQESQEYMIQQQQQQFAANYNDQSNNEQDECDLLEFIDNEIINENIEDNVELNDDDEDHEEINDFDDDDEDENFILYRNEITVNNNASDKISETVDLENNSNLLSNEDEEKIMLQEENHQVRCHQKMASTLHQINCDLCDFKTKLAKEFLKHRSEVHRIFDKNIYACKLCPERFSIRRKLFKHIEEIHNVLPDEKKYICSVCGKTYCRATHLSLHQKECHAPRLYQCNYCDHQFTRSFTLKRHIQAIHSDNAVYYCGKCKKSFKAYGSWKYHNNVVHKNHLVYCPKCGYGFRHKDKLDEHLAKNNCKNAIIPCDYCQRKFTTPVGLINHMKNIHRF